MTTAAPPSAMARSPWKLAVAGFAVLFSALAPLIGGARTLYLRDLLNYHYTVKLSQSRAMAEGLLPLVDPFRAGGQPLVGNLNNVALYPDNLLYLFASPMWAMNAHMWIHLLLAPVGGYAMARAWGLGKEASWATGFLYATCGFFLSLLNLYNMIAGAALAPAFVAACLLFSQGRRRALSLVAVGVLWCLTILAGEPLIAGLVLLAGVSAVLARGSLTLRGTALLAAAVACGTVLAAPQLVELLRILPSSYRVGVGYSHESRLVGSWDPRMVIEWFAPLFFGEPGFRYWGHQLQRGVPPLFYSFYPGLLALALVFASRRPRSRAELWSWAAVSLGIFMALGRSNPVVFELLELPQASFLRYPAKWFLLVALGGSLLAGTAFERAACESGRRRLGLGLAALGGLMLASSLVLWLRPAVVVASLGGVLAEAFAAEEVLRWRTLVLISLALVVAYLALLAASRRWRAATSAMVVLHVASQLMLLGSLAATDDAAAYRDPPPVLDLVEPGERVLQTCVADFGCGERRAASFPDGSLFWLQRRGWSELFPFAGVGFGISYAFNASPEGLDSFLPVATAAALPGLPDGDLIRVLEASSVDAVLIGRPLAADVADRVRLRGTIATLGGRLWVYGLTSAAPDVRLVGRVRSGETRVVMRALLDPTFDPVLDVFVPGRPEGRVDGAPGTARETSSGPESWTYEVSSADGGLLVLARAQLPVYLAEVDGEGAQVLVVNSGQMAVEVPPGRHEVRLRVDRGPFRRAILASAIALLVLSILAAVAARRAEAGPSPPGVTQSPA